MATTLVIPTDTGPDTQPQVLRCTLDGVLYQLLLRWNARGQFWRLDLQDSSGAALAAGLPVQNAGVPVGGCLFGHATFPPGVLLALATASPQVDAGLEELGARVLLTYSEASGG